MLKKRDFDKAFADRRRAANRRLCVFVRDNGLPYCRIGLTVGKRIGNSVVRHRVRRCLREAFRLQQHLLPPGLDLICVAQSCDEADTRAYADALMRLVPIAKRKPGR